MTEKPTVGSQFLGAFSSACISKATKVVNLQVKVKESRNKPDATQRVPRGLGSQISLYSAREGGEVVSLMHRPPLPPGMFLGAESVPGPWKGRKEICHWKIQWRHRESTPGRMWMYIPLFTVKIPVSYTSDSRQRFEATAHKINKQHFKFAATPSDNEAVIYLRFPQVLLFDSWHKRTFVWLQKKQFCCGLYRWL
jgi:hypothetical protein